MRSRSVFIMGAGILAVTIAAREATVTGQGRQGPGIQAPADAREPELLKSCKNPPPPAPARGGGGGEGGAARGGEGQGPGAAANAGPKDVTSAEIPGVIAAGQKWKVLWVDEGNNADGIVGANDGRVLISRNDKSDVVKVDKDGKASVVYTDTNTGGTLGMNQKGELFVAARGYQAAILQLAPRRRIVANKYGPDGDWFDCIGGVLHDLSPDSKGGIYVAIGAPVLYIDPKGVTTRYGDEKLRGNGIILSPDEKRLYVTTGTSLMVFDVQANGALANQREFAKLEGGPGDGLAVDAAGRVYASGNGIRVVDASGKFLGAIPTPRNTITTAFGGPDKKMLYAIAAGNDNGRRVVELIGIQMIAQGYKGRPK